MGLLCRKGMEFWGRRAGAEMLLQLLWLLQVLPMLLSASCGGSNTAPGALGSAGWRLGTPGGPAPPPPPSLPSPLLTYYQVPRPLLGRLRGSISTSWASSPTANPRAKPSTGADRRGASSCTALSFLRPSFARASPVGRNKLGFKERATLSAAGPDPARTGTLREKAAGRVSLGG